MPSTAWQVSGAEQVSADGTIALRGLNVAFDPGTTPLMPVGRTSGTYRLQIRLQETDEVPGSTIHGADIYYATNAVDLEGLPTNSTITVEADSVNLNGGTANTSATARTWATCWPPTSARWPWAVTSAAQRT